MLSFHFLGRVFPASLLVLAGIVALPSPAHSDAKTYEPQRWESKIDAFEELDAKDPPPQNGVLFVGSSSIRMWDLEKSFPDLPVVNRGFGGSHIADSTYYADRIIVKHRPRVVVLYAGDNDIAHDMSPQEVLRDYQAFVQTLRERLPETKIVFIAIKPSIKRWHLIEKIRRANAGIRHATKHEERLAFVDIDRPMIGADGQPREELFQDDGLHLNAKGYELWASLLRPHLEP
jgi:lysophospholipase L1-like esterase